MSRNARLASVAAVARAVRLAVRPGGPTIGERAGAVPRMVRATFRGDYVGVSKGKLLLMLGAAGYLVSPLDLIPEAVLPIVGLADDALVLSWLATRLVEETEAFLAWENGIVDPSGGPSGSAGPAGAAYAGGDGAGATGGTNGAGASGASTGSNRPAASQVVPGDVVH
jgi:uncharacterized membrane protein YkvA (DUF1232 family)